jgi:oxygen-independent coproporphyrinogen III oxidase
VWCSGLTCIPVKDETAGSNPVTSAFNPLKDQASKLESGFLLCKHIIRPCVRTDFSERNICFIKVGAFIYELLRWALLEMTEDIYKATEMQSSITEAEIARQEAANGYGIYLHIPFCKTRCTYCDFNTYTNLTGLQGRYAIALAQEAERSLAAIGAGVYNPLAPLPELSELGNTSLTGTVNTIFFGGGTPSLLPPSFLGRSLEAIARRAQLAPDVEITIEANPGTLTLEKLRGLRDIGVNRLSFGVQTFDNALLKSLGRTHTGAGAVEALEMARRAGFDNVNLDFIYGLPTQTLASWQATLRRAISIRPAHLSIYALSVEEGTTMYRQVEAGKIAPPASDEVAEMYETALDMLSAAGYIQYEISNWALGAPGETAGTTPARACRHNLIYWRNQAYLSFGPGAHSSFAGWRFAVLDDPTEYVRRLKAGQSVIVTADAERTTPALKLADTIILGLRLNEGLALGRIEREFGKTLDDYYPGIVQKHIANGLLEYVAQSNGETTLRLTRRGLLLSNEVFVDFLAE